MPKVPGQTWAETEMQYGTDPIGHKTLFLNASCGPTAAAMAESWANQHWQPMVNLYQRMRLRGLCDPNGSSTIYGLEKILSADGHNVVEVLDYSPAIPVSRWRAFFAKHLPPQAEHVVLYQTANGQALFDSNSNRGEDAVQLRSHFLLLKGQVDQHGEQDSYSGKWRANGYYALDGDNWSIRHLAIPNHVEQFYSLDVVQASRPVAALAIAARAPLPGAGGGAMTNLPPGWNDDPQKGELYFVDTTGARWQYCFRLGFRDYVLALLSQGKWDKRNIPLEDEHGADPMELTNSDIKAGTQQACLLTTLEWNQDTGVFEMAQGRELLETRHRYADAQQTIAAQQAQIAQLQQAVSSGAGGDATATRKTLSDFYKLLTTS